MFWTGVQALGSRLVSTLVFLFLAHLLDPKVFGVVALAAVAISLMSVFVEQGLGEALVQKKELDVAHYDTAFFASFGCGLLLAALLVLVAQPVSNALGEPQLAPVLQGLALVLPIAGLNSVPEAIFQKELEFRTLAARRIAGNLVGGGVGVAAALAGFGVWSLVLQTVIGTGVECLLVWIKTDWRPGLNLSLRHFRDLFHFGSRVMFSELLNFFNRNSDNLLIGAVLGPVALGLYSVGYRILLLMTEVLTRTIFSVSFPIFSRVQDDPPRLRRGFLKVTQLSAAVAFPCFAIVAVLAPEIVRTMFGPQWLGTVPVMQVLAIVGALQAILFFNSSVLMATGHPGWVLRITAVNAVLSVIGFAVSVHWGIVAVAASYTIRGYLMAPVYVLATKKVVKFDGRRYLMGLLGPIGATAVCVALVFFGRSWLASNVPAVVVLAIMVPVGLLAYAIALRIGSPGVAHELGRLMRSAMPSLRPGRKPLTTAGGDAPL